MKKFLSILLTFVLLLGLLCACAPTSSRIEDEQERLRREEEERQRQKDIEELSEPEGDDPDPDYPPLDHVIVVPNTQKVLRDEKIVPNGVGVLTATLARNEDEGMQFLLRFAETTENVKVTVSELVNLKGETMETRLYRQYYYHLSGAPYKVNGDYPDGLIPLFDGSDGFVANDTCTVEANKNQGFWLTVEAKDRQRAGIYRGSVTVTADGIEPIVIPIKVRVYSFAIPSTPSMPTVFLAGWSNGYYEDRGISPQDMNKMVWELSLKYRISGGQMDFIPYGITGEDIPKYVQAMKEFCDEHPEVTMIKIPINGFSWDAYRADENATPLASNPDNIEMYRCLKEAGLADKCVYYFIDEPGVDAGTFDVMRRSAEEVRSFAPEFRMVVPMEAFIMNNYDYFFPKLNGWVPKWKNDVIESVVRKKIAAGDTVLWYGCCDPDIPFPTYRTNDNLVSPRIIHWMQRDYGVQGELYWGLSLFNCLSGNAYVGRMDVWKTEETQPGIPGDGLLMLPGKVGDGIVERDMLVPTLRLEAIRDGMEDYEYLTMLENRAQAIIEKYKLPFTSDEYMDTFYGALYVMMHLYDSTPETVLAMRDIVAHDLMNNADVLVRVEDGEKGTRIVSVFAPSGTAVSADGVTFTEEVCDGYSVYRATYPASGEQSVISVKVGNVTYERFLRQYSR